ALPPACAAVTPGLRTATVAPLYRATRARLAAAGASLGAAQAVTLAFGPHRYDVTVSAVGAAGTADVWLVDCPVLYDRDGLYGDAHGDFGDNHLRFTVLCRAALAAAPAIL